MNKKFNVVWSKTKHRYIVTSEITRTHGKGSQARAKGAAVTLAVLIALSGSTAFAAGTNSYEAEGSATGNNSVAIGMGASAAGNNSVAIGNNSKVDQANSIAIGRSATTSSVNNNTSFTVNGTSYDTGMTASGAVSFGTSSSLKQIQNVAPGTVNSNSTDAVNGAQLSRVIDSIQGQTIAYRAGASGTYSTALLNPNTGTKAGLTFLNSNNLTATATANGVTYDLNNAVKVGTISIDGSNNATSGGYITGLKNTTWSSENYEANKATTASRAATEGQVYSAYNEIMQSGISLVDDTGKANVNDATDLTDKAKATIGKYIEVKGNNSNISTEASTTTVNGISHGTMTIKLNNDLNLDSVTVGNSKFSKNDGLSINNGAITATNDGNLSVGGTLGVIGATTLSNTLDVKGTTTLENTLNVTGATKLNNTLEVVKDATFDANTETKGNQLVDGTQEVKGKATFDSATETKGNATFDADTETKGSAQIDKNLTVKGTSDLKGDVTMEANASIAGDETVGGNSAIGGNQTIGGTLGVTGATTLGSTLDVTGATKLNDTLEVVNDATFDANTLTKGNNTVNGTSHLIGDVTMDSNAFVAKDLAVGGNQTIGGTLGVTGATTLKDTLEVMKNATFDADTETKGSAQIDKNLTVKGTSHLVGDVTMDGNASVAKNLSVKGNADVTGNQTIGGTLGVTGATTLKDTLEVMKNATFDADTETKGSAQIDKDLTVKGNAAVTGNQTIGGTLGVTGATTLKDTLEVVKNATFDADTETKGSATIDKNLTVNGASSLVGDVTMGGNASVAKNLTVTGNQTIGGTLGVTGATKLNNTLEVVKNATFDADTTTNGKASIGNVVINGSNSATITGLSNTTFKDGDTFKEDQLQADRAATEGEVHEVYTLAKQHTTVVNGSPEQLTINAGTNTSGGIEYTIAANTATAVQSENANLVTSGTMYNELRPADGNYVKQDNTTAQNLTVLDSQAKTNNDAILQEINDRKTAINEEAAARTAEDTNLSNNIRGVDDRSKQGIARASALAALHPLDYDPADKWNFAVGYGNYRGENAAALGAFYRPNENVMVYMGSSISGNDNALNAGVSFKLGQGNVTSTSRAAMAEQMQKLQSQNLALARQNNALADKVMSQDAKIARLEAQVQALMKASK